MSAWPRLGLFSAGQVKRFPPLPLGVAPSQILSFPQLHRCSDSLSLANWSDINNGCQSVKRIFEETNAQS